MSTFTNPVFSSTTFGSVQSGSVDFLKYLVETQPPPYRAGAARDILERLLKPSAEDLARVYEIIEYMDQLVLPESTVAEWLQLILTEWMGWTLVPDGYPVERTRRLLKNLHLHYKRRYTVRGIQGLLREFGVINQVYDRPLYVAGYYGSFASSYPLRARVRILGVEPFSSPRRTYVGGYYGGTILHTTRQVITDSFVMDLIRWARVASTRVLVEWKTYSYELAPDAPILDDDEIVP